MDENTTTRIQNTPPVGIPSAEYTTALKLLAQANKSRVARRRRSWINSRLSSLRFFLHPFLITSFLALSFHVVVGLPFFRPPSRPPPRVVTPYGADVCCLLEKNSTFVYAALYGIHPVPSPSNFRSKNLTVCAEIHLYRCIEWLVRAGRNVKSDKRNASEENKGTAAVERKIIK